MTAKRGLGGNSPFWLLNQTGVGVAFWLASGDDAKGGNSPEGARVDCAARYISTAAVNMHLAVHGVHLKCLYASRAAKSTARVPAPPFTCVYKAGNGSVSCAGAAVQLLPPDAGVAVPLYAAVQLQRGGSLVGDVAQIRAALSPDGRDPGNAEARSDLQVACNPIPILKLSRPRTYPHSYAGIIPLRSYIIP